MAEEKKVRYGPTSYSTAYYNSPEAAAAAASSIFNAMSIPEDVEVGGGIVQHAKTGKYYYSFTLGDPGAGTVNIAFMKRPDDQLVGVWHTHGKVDATTHLFSSEDIDVADQLGMPLYMADGQGHLRRVQPGAKKRKIKYKYPGSIGFWGTAENVSEGEQIMHPETGEPLVIRNEPGEEIIQPGQLNFPRPQAQ